MAVVLRLPDRPAADPREARQAGGSGRSAEILILPCIRRESLDRQPSLDLPQQLQA